MRAGASVRIGSNALGIWVEGPSGGADFSHPFTVLYGGGVARVSKGLILGDVAVEPRIGDVPISGDDERPAPTLAIDPALVNERGESWVCVEVTPDAEGKLSGKTAKIEVVQRDHPIVTLGGTGRAPLAMLIFRAGSESARVLQIAMFHFRYATSQPATSRRAHFFA